MKNKARGERNGDRDKNDGLPMLTGADLGIGEYGNEPTQFRMAARETLVQILVRGRRGSEEVFLGPSKSCNPYARNAGKASPELGFHSDDRNSVSSGQAGDAPSDYPPGCLPCRLGPLDHEDGIALGYCKGHY